MNNNPKLTAKVQSLSGQTKAEAEQTIQTVLAAVKTVAQEEGKVTLQGYGTFSVKQKAATTARNPRTGDTVNVPAKEVFVFKASK
jgi:DNA-binding protein HU-beta